MFEFFKHMTKEEMDDFDAYFQAFTIFLLGIIVGGMMVFFVMR